ncbi:hypothetical protein ACOKFD_06025 [Flagellimonas sp. S174]|uniref:hypothetical protein n=1 Tax=Flagellimonas sp. S174 TaxID=3410790 RepID=UPI003BF5A50E
MQFLVACLLFFFLSVFPLHTSAQTATDSLNPPLVHMVTFERVSSRNYQSWSIQYREFEKQSKEFVIPLTLSFGNTTIDGSFLENKDIKEVDTYSLGFGFDGYEYLGSGFYFNLGLGAFPGVETIERQNNDRTTGFLIGGTASTGFLFIPFPEFGLVLGLNAIGRLSNSKVISSSIGFGIEAGFNF